MANGLNENSLEASTYRTSHASVGYGDCYQKTYQQGYYAELWRQIERPLLQRILLRLRDEGAVSCLDFACGTGRITQVVEDVFPASTGVDVSESMLEVARRQCSRTTFIFRDITKNPLESRFDVITAFRFFLNAEQSLRDEVLAAMRASLSPHGTLVVNVHVNRTSLLGIAYSMRNRLKGRVVANTLGFDEMRGMLEAHGFVVKRVHWYGFYPRTGWYLGFLAKWLIRPVDGLFSVLRFLPRKWAQNFIIEAELRA
jgi:SAM-dependent methyltransferase